MVQLFSLSLPCSAPMRLRPHDTATVTFPYLAHAYTYTHTYIQHTSVNEEHSLHQEVDPRYRGSHIPSRAFRILQNFTATDSSAAEDGKPYVTNRQKSAAYLSNPNRTTIITPCYKHLKETKALLIPVNPRSKLQKVQT